MTRFQKRMKNLFFDDFIIVRLSIDFKESLGFRTADASAQLEMKIIQQNLIIAQVNQVKCYPFSILASPANCCKQNFRAV